MYVVKNEYIDTKENKFENIKNIHFPTFKDVAGNLGTFITETKYENNCFSSYSYNQEDGVYIYRTNYNPKKALRIYKDIADYKFTSHDDAELVRDLLKVQKDVKLTEFPTGIVTVENKVVGQEIVLYDNFVTIREKFKNKELKKNPVQCYIEMLEILKELYNVGVVYSDLHAKNFLISEIDETIKLIDFDRRYTQTESSKFDLRKSMISNLKAMLSKLNDCYDLSFGPDYKNAETLDEIEECVYSLKKK